MSYRPLIAISLLLTTVACSNTSLEDYREEAEGITRSLLKEMQAVHSRKDLAEHAPRLKKLFNKLVDVIIAADEFKEHYEVEILPLGREEHLLSDALYSELSRLYAIEGARDIVERAQQEALYRLDAYLKKVKSVKD